jgi:Zn finger protein HypA/HybF involved in hydrogenase expression
MTKKLDNLLCKHCQQPFVPVGKERICPKCKENYTEFRKASGRTATAKYRAKVETERKETGLCIRCGSPKEPGREDHVECRKCANHKYLVNVQRMHRSKKAKLLSLKLLSTIIEDIYDDVNEDGQKALLLLIGELEPFIGDFMNRDWTEYEQKIRSNFPKYRLLYDKLSQNISFWEDKFNKSAKLSGEFSTDELKSIVMMMERHTAHELNETQEMKNWKK